MASPASLQRLVPPPRFKEENFLKILLYFPIGLLLLSIRIFSGIVVWLCSAILSEFSIIRYIITNITCIFTLGIHLKVSGERDEKTRLLVANSVSSFDSLVLHVATNSLNPSKWDLPIPLAWTLGIRHVEEPSTVEQYKDVIRKKFANAPNPIFIQPEGCPTSGKGLLKFNNWPFSLYDKVQPVAIEVQHCFGSVTSESLNYWSGDGVSWIDIFWFLWNPYTAFEVHLLPVIEKIENESCEEFSTRTQKNIADYLKIEATEYTSNDLRDLVASQEAERAQMSLSVSSRNIRERITESIPTIRPDLQTMVAQIKEVLPNVPASVISKDLSKTHNVDITITNILEGRIPYTPEDERTLSSSATAESIASTSKTTIPAPPLRTAAATFSRNAHDRQLSFQERKAQLIEAARRRYIEKHGLKNC